MQTLFPDSHFGFEAAVRIGKRLLVGIAAAVTIGHIALLVGSRAFTAVPAAMPSPPDGSLTGVPRAAIACARSYAFSTSECLHEIAVALQGANHPAAGAASLAARTVPLATGAGSACPDGLRKTTLGGPAKHSSSRSDA